MATETKLAWGGVPSSLSLQDMGGKVLDRIDEITKNFSEAQKEIATVTAVAVMLTGSLYFAPATALGFSVCGYLQPKYVKKLENYLGNALTLSTTKIQKQIFIIACIGLSALYFKSYAIPAVIALKAGAFFGKKFPAQKTFEPLVDRAQKFGSSTFDRNV